MSLHRLNFSQIFRWKLKIGKQIMADTNRQFTLNCLAMASFQKKSIAQIGFFGAAQI